MADWTAATACARGPGARAVPKAESREPRPYRWSTGASTRVSLSPDLGAGLSTSAPGGADAVSAAGGSPVV
eukprot:606397-Alexandrium_andersonii.AAC.1